MSAQERIILDPKVLLWKPIIKGTRISVEFVLEMLAGGWTEQEILEGFPWLTHEDILACLEYA